MKNHSPLDLAMSTSVRVTEVSVTRRQRCSRGVKLSVSYGENAAQTDESEVNIFTP